MSTTPKLVVIESPYAPGSGTPELREANLKRYIDYAILCMRDSLARGECPFASHLLYTHKGLLNDDVPAEREQGIAAGVAWGRHADLTAVYIDFGISSGMRLTPRSPLAVQSITGAWALYNLLSPRFAGCRTLCGDLLTSVPKRA